MRCPDNGMQWLNQFLAATAPPNNIPSNIASCGCTTMGVEDSNGCRPCRPRRTEPTTNVISGSTDTIVAGATGCRGGCGCGCGACSNCTGVITNRLLCHIIRQLDAIYELLEELVPDVA